MLYFDEPVLSIEDDYYMDTHPEETIICEIMNHVDDSVYQNELDEIKHLISTEVI